MSDYGYGAFGGAYIFIVILILVYAVWLFFFPILVIGRLNRIIKLLEKFVNKDNSEK